MIQAYNPACRQASFAKISKNAILFPFFYNFIDAKAVRMALEKSERFIITCQGCYTASELVQGKYDWSNPLFTDERFPLEKHDPVKRIVEPVEFDHHVSTREVLAKLTSEKLWRPTYEDAFYFGIRHRDAYLKRPWVFLHEPVDTPSPVGAQSVFPRYIVIYSFNNVRVIDLYVDDGWIKFCLFAGIRVEN